LDYNTITIEPTTLTKPTSAASSLSTLAAPAAADRLRSCSAAKSRSAWQDASWRAAQARYAVAWALTRSTAVRQTLSGKVAGGMCTKNSVKKTVVAVMVVVVVVVVVVVGAWVWGCQSEIELERA
jgi:hypothetical protein